MSRLIPRGYLTIREAADEIASAMYAGEPDRPAVKELREAGIDVADGAAIEGAISKLWAAVDRKKIQAFVVGPTRAEPLKLTSEMSKAIPALRSARGRDLNFLRASNLYHKQFVQWFGLDFSTISVVFRGEDIKSLARSLLRARRRQAASAKGKVGRPSRRADVEAAIREVIDRGRWCPTQSIKALTREVNRLGKCVKPVSDETVGRVLKQLHEETVDRRFERVQRAKAASPLRSEVAADA